MDGGDAPSLLFLPCESIKSIMDRDTAGKAAGVELISHCDLSSAVDLSDFTGFSTFTGFRLFHNDLTY